MNSAQTTPPRPVAPEPVRLGARTELLLVICIAALPALVKLLWYWSYPGSDDVFAHLRIAETLAAGGGWGMDPGQPLSLSSSPVFTGLIALGLMLGFGGLGFGMFVSLASGFLATIAAHRLLVLLGIGFTARIAGVVFAAANIYLWRWNGTVMETTLAFLLLTLAYQAFHRAERQPQEQRRRRAGGYFAAGVVAGLAVLTRFELALVLPCFGVALLVRRPARWFAAGVALGAGFAVAVLPWFAFSLVYFNALLPTPFYAKTSSAIYLWNPAVARELLKLVISGFGVPLLVLGALSISSLWKRRALQVRGIFSPLDVWLFPLALALFYYVKTPGLQSSARYFLPALHMLAVALACALDALLRAERRAWWDRAVYAALGLHVVFGLAFNHIRVAPVLARYRDNYWRTMEAAADFLRNNDPTRREGVLVEIDFGTLWYYAGDECTFYDGGAVASPDLRGLSVVEKIRRTEPELVVETLASEAGEMAKTVPGLHLIWHREFRSHSIGRPDAVYVCNIYRVGE